MRGGLICLAVLALTLAGCGRKDGKPAAANPAFSKRVICASPAVAEIVFALGCGDRVVGVSEFTDWPAAAARKPVIGGVLAPNRERILALEPDLILAQGKAEALANFAISHGIAFQALPLDTLDDLRAAISGFANALGVAKKARVLLAEMEEGFSGLPRCGPVAVFLALGHAPGDLSGLMTSGPGTFLDELVALAGGSNIFSDLSVPWPRISQEALVRRNPTVILDCQPDGLDAARRDALLADWERLGFAQRQVRLLDEDYLLKPGPRAIQTVQYISQLLCPQ